jgi:hypothetical protein
MTSQRLSGRRHSPGVRVTPRGLVPGVDTPWLTPRSWVRPGAYVVLGIISLSLILCVMIDRLNAQRWPNARMALVFLLVALMMGAFYTLGMVVMHTLHRVRSQYCPDCLQVMTRGAHVCPWCGLRPTPGEPGVLASRSLQRTDAAPS